MFTKTKESKGLPLEKSLFQMNSESGRPLKEIPGLDKEWTTLKQRSFAAYMHHPEPGPDGNFVPVEREKWVKLLICMKADLIWLLEQKHHVFWSHMVFSEATHLLLKSFLSEAPPYYLKAKFQEDEVMMRSYSIVKYLVFVVLVRLSTKAESSECYIEKFDTLIYENYLFTVPMLLDICLIYGMERRDLVMKMFNDVINHCPMLWADFREIIPRFEDGLYSVKSFFERILPKRSDANNSKVIFNILSLRDLAANIQMLFVIYPMLADLFRTDTLTNEISSFYASVIPVLYRATRECGIETLESQDVREIIGEIRIDLLSIMNSIFCEIMNDVLCDINHREEHVMEYLSKLTGILQESVFMNDYKRLYNVNSALTDLQCLSQSFDMENYLYIREALNSAANSGSSVSNSSVPETAPPEFDFEVTGVELDSLISQVKDLLHNLGEGYIEMCLRHYKYEPEDTIAAILSNKLPFHLTVLDTSLKREDVKKLKPAMAKPNLAEKKPTVTVEAQVAEFFNDKSDLEGLRDKYARLALVSDEEYDDEYDDTYDSHSASVAAADELAELYQRPIVTPRVLRTREERVEEEEEEEEEEDDDDDDEAKAANAKADHFVPNPAEVRAKQEQKRMEKAKRDNVWKGKGHGQNRSTSANHHFKEVHKEFIGNHNKKKRSARKRNFPLC